MNKLLSDLYEKASSYCIEINYINEITWQSSLNFCSFTEVDLLREASWVILCSGFRENYIRKIFNYISLCFFDWESAKTIVEQADLCINTALSIFNNSKKITAITGVAKFIVQKDFFNYKYEIINNPISALQELPYIGPITAQHLAKTIGFNTLQNQIGI